MDNALVTDHRMSGHDSTFMHSEPDHPDSTDYKKSVDLSEQHLVDNGNGQQTVIQHEGVNGASNNHPLAQQAAVETGMCLEEHPNLVPDLEIENAASNLQQPATLAPQDPQQDPHADAGPATSALLPSTPAPDDQQPLPNGSSSSTEPTVAPAAPSSKEPGEAAQASESPATTTLQSPLPRNPNSPTHRVRSILLRTATTITAEGVAAAAAAAAGDAADSPRPKGLRVSFCEQLEEAVALISPRSSEDEGAGEPRGGVEGSACCAVM